MIIDRVAERLVRDGLAAYDIEVGGSRAWDLRVHDPSWYRRFAVNPQLQLGETYMDGAWDCDAIDELLFRLSTPPSGGVPARGWKWHVRNAWAWMTNPQSKARAHQVAEQHYDRELELMRLMLDEETMSYTCAYFQEGDSLVDAQRNKLAKMCAKLALEPGDLVLDIGCGFGGFARYAVEHHGARVVGVTNSKLHHEVARERCKGLDVSIELLDYRAIPSLRRTFDKVASIEMIEAVGPKNFETYMQGVYDVLRPGGRFVMQSIISNTSQHVCNEWFDRYIFPNGVSPSFAQLSSATERNLGAPHVTEDFGPHYATTLLAWDQKLAARWHELQDRTERTRRMWHFYLTSVAGVFRAGDLRLFQIAYARR